MSRANQPDEGQPGQERGDAQVVPFPGTQHNLPDLPQPTEVELADLPLEGELIDEQEYQERKGLQRYMPVTVLVQVVHVVRESPGGTAGKATLRASVTVAQGFKSWAVRSYNAASYGVYRAEIQAARDAGDHERLADWTFRHEQAKEQRHKRLADAPKTMLGLSIIAGGCLLGLVVVILLVGLLAEVSGAGEFVGVISGVLGAIRFLFEAVPVAVTVGVVATPAVLLYSAWREGLRTGLAPRWLLNEEQRGEYDAVITPDVLTLALQHVKIPALTKYLAAGGKLEFLGPPREQGGGTYAQIRLPIGVMAAELLKSDKVELLAGNLSRHSHEVWPQRQPKADARVLDVWIADKGTMDKKAPPWPLQFDGEVDVWRDRLPWGVTMRSEQIAVGMLQKHWLVGATSKQGKTTVVRLLALGLALDPTVELHIADLKGDGDWSMFRPRAVTLIEGSADEDAEATTDMLEWGVAEMRRRYEVKTEQGITVNREVSRRIGSGFHPIWLIVDECQVLYGAPHPIGGTKDDARAWRAAKRLHDQARAVNIHLVQATQRPDNRTLPVQVREGAHVRCALNVPNYETAKMVLADAADRGARPQDLRPGADAGTVVATGDVEDIPVGQAFAIVRTHYVTTADAYAVLDRAMQILHRTGRVVGPPPELVEGEDAAEEVDHLADIAEVLEGERRVRTQVVLARLIQHNPAEYEKWDLVRLTAVLKGPGADPVKTGGGVMFVDAERVAIAIAERDR